MPPKKKSAKSCFSWANTYHVERFIHEVEEVKGLWDKSCDGYKDPKKRTQLWLLVAYNLYYYEWSEMSVQKQQKISKDCQMHWKQIKHDFFEECAKGTNQRPKGKRNTNKIKYYDNLSFLLPTSQKKSIVANGDDHGSDVTDASSSSNASDTDDSNFKNYYEGSSDDDQLESP